MTTPQEFAKQLRRFAKYVAEQPRDWLDDWDIDEDPVSVIHALWDRMLDCDCFGTEGQLDPRGDRRD